MKINSETMLHKCSTLFLKKTYVQFRERGEWMVHYGSSGLGEKSGQKNSKDEQQDQMFLNLALDKHL